MIKSTITYFVPFIITTKISSIFHPKKGSAKFFLSEERKKWKKILSDLFSVLVWLAILALLTFLVSLGSLSIFESLLLVLGIGVGLAVIFLYIIGGIEKFVKENRN